ncbi:MAG: hypothetical protein WKF43_16855 [Acidimicrobiales bacterium]
MCPKRAHDGRSSTLTGDELTRDRLDHAYALTAHRPPPTARKAPPLTAPTPSLTAAAGELTYVAMS